MPKPNHLATSLVLAMLLGAAASGPLFNVSAAPLGATSPPLGAAASYSVLAGETVTNTGPTTMPGDLGVSPGSAVTGFPPGIVGPPGIIHAADANAAAAQAANTAAFAALIAVPNAECDTDYGAIVQELAGLTLVPGVYCANTFHLAGTLTLDDTSAGDGVWIFRSDLATVVTTPGVGAKVQFLTGIGSPCNVWWRVASSATIGAGTEFIGNILALTSISLGTGASLNGRAFAQTGAVTLDTNTITGPTCGVAATSTSAAATSTSAAATNVAATSTSAAATALFTPPPESTAIPAPTLTPSPAPTIAATVPAVVGLPPTGGAPLQRGDSSWFLVLVVGGLSALALGLTIRAQRRRVR